jgi:hypothetical protein
MAAEQVTANDVSGQLPVAVQDAILDETTHSDTVRAKVKAARVKTATAGTSDRTTAMLYVLAAVVAALVAEEAAT